MGKATSRGARIFAQRDRRRERATPRHARLQPRSRPPRPSPRAAQRRRRVAQSACPPADRRRNSRARPGGWRRRACACCGGAAQPLLFLRIGDIGRLDQHRGDVGRFQHHEARLLHLGLANLADPIQLVQHALGGDLAGAQAMRTATGPAAPTRARRPCRRARRRRSDPRHFRARQASARLRRSRRAGTGCTPRSRRRCDRESNRHESRRTRSACCARARRIRSRSGTK